MKPNTRHVRPVASWLPTWRCAARAAGSGRRFSLALLLGACSGAGAATEPPKQLPPLAAPSVFSAYRTPAQLLLHPPRGGVSVRATLRLDDGRCVLGAENGDVFFSVKSEKGCGLVGAGGGEHALPPIEALAKLDNGRVGFVVDGGGVHVIEAGALSVIDVLPAPAPLSSIVATERVLGLTPSGRLFELSRAGRWEPRSPTLPPNTRLADMVGAGSAVMALTSPESVLLSTDGGVTLQPSGAQQVGAVRLAPIVGGGFAALGPLGAVTWRGASGALQLGAGVGVESGPAEAPSEALASGDFPDALAFHERRGVFVGTMWLELRRGRELARPEETEDWFLLSGELGEPLSKKRLASVGRCEEPKLAASGEWVGVLCPDARGQLRVFHGPLAGQLVSVHQAPATAAADLAVAPNGSILLVGVCRSRSDCKSALALLTPQPKGNARVEPVAVEPVALARAPIFSPEGRRAYFLGARESDGKPGLFVSADGGRSFVLKPIDETHGLQLGERPQLALGEDGVVSAVLEAPKAEERSAEQHAVVLFEQSGETREVSRRFPGNQWVSAFGSRLLAFHGGEPPATALTESSDGGKTWDDVPFTRKLDDDDIELRHVACGWGGCVIGSAMTRLGWGAAGGMGGLGLRGVLPQVGWLTPLQCELDAKAKWQTAETDRLPGAGEIALGSALWSAPYSHPSGEEARVVVARAGRLDTKTLLSKRSGPHAISGPVSSPHGWAVSRVALPKGGPSGQPMRGVEVAWEHLGDGSSGRGTIADAGVFPPTDEPPTAHVVSATGGVFVRPTGGPGPGWLVGKKTSQLAFPAAPAGAAGFEHATPRGLVVGGSPLFALEPDSPVPSFVMASRAPSAQPSDPFKLTATSFGSFAQSRHAFLDAWWTLTSQGSAGVPALVVLGVSPNDGSWLTLHRVAAGGSFGPAEKVATPLELGGAPRACTADERKNTPRLVVRHDAKLDGRTYPSFAGMRRPIAIGSIMRPTAPGKPQELVEPPVLLTTSVVYHVTPSGPCVAGHAVGTLPGRLTNGNEVVWSAVIGGEPSDSWLLRYRSPLLEAYPMRCRYKDGVLVTSDVRRRLDADAP